MKGLGISRAAFLGAILALPSLGRLFEPTLPSLKTSNLNWYRRRGYGKRYGNDCTDWSKHRNGKRECARRVRQMAKGMLPPGERIEA